MKSRSSKLQLKMVDEIEKWTDDLSEEQRDLFYRGVKKLMINSRISYEDAVITMAKIILYLAELEEKCTSRLH